MQTPPGLAEAREQFLGLVAGVRPELHRYCARLTGSVIDGEDLVQDALAKAFYAMSQSVELPPLRPWLFRIAHNAALDFLKSHGRKFAEPLPEGDDDESLEALPGAVWSDDRPDPIVVRAALARFLTLPVAQRSAVILKDVLGHSLEEMAETMGRSIMAVKAALVRGRRQLLSEAEPASGSVDTLRAELRRYASLFNARDWDGVRAMIGDDCKLDLVSKSQRRGKEVGMYFSNYEKVDMRLRLVELEGREAFAVYAAGAGGPSYFILAEVENGLVTSIRDYRYVPYIAAEAVFDPLSD